MDHRTSACWIVSVLMLVALQSTGCAGNPETPVPAPSLGASIQSIFEDFDDDSPGAAVMVVRNGEIIHAKGHGLADLDNRQPFGPSTPVRLASLSKAFTAMAIVMLVERGAVGYDTPASAWIPELARFETVTVRHLLHHTSGLPSYYRHKMAELEAAAEAKSAGARFTNADAVAVYEDWGELEFEPGSRYQYSNPGYEILGLIIERASGETYGTFLKTNIFEPLGMKTAIVRDSPDVVIADRAIGYSRDGDGFVENDDHWANWVVGAGGVYASLDDLYLWDRALSDNTLVSAESTEKIFSPADLNDGSTSPYGLGWGLEDIAGHTAAHHTGSWVGFRTAIARFPDDRLTVVVLSNTITKAAELRDAVAEAALDRFVEAP